MAAKLSSFLLLTAAIFFASCGTIANFSRITTKYDDMTGVTVKDLIIAKDRPFLASGEKLFFRQASKKDEPPAYFICFDLMVSSWWFVDTLLVKELGAEPLYLQKIDGDTDILYGGSVHEWVVFPASVELLETIASSAGIRLRMQGSKNYQDYEITPGDQARMKDFLQQLGL